MKKIGVQCGCGCGYGYAVMLVVVVVMVMVMLVVVVVDGQCLVGFGALFCQDCAALIRMGSVEARNTLENLVCQQKMSQQQKET